MFEKLKAWWNRPLPDRRGYNNAAYAQPCHKPTVVPPPPPGARISRPAFDICKIASDLSAVTHISPGEALEMIRKAGNFGSQEEVDRLQLENIELRQALDDSIMLAESHTDSSPESHKTYTRLPACPARTSPLLSGSDVEIVLLIRGDIFKGVDGRPDTQDIEMLIHGPKLSQPTTMRWVCSLSSAPLSFTFGSPKGEPHRYELVLKQNERPKPPVWLSDGNIGLHEETHDASIRVGGLPKPKPPPPETDTGKMDTFQKAYMGVPFKEDESG